MATDEFDNAIGRMAAFMNAAGVESERQIALVTADPDGLTLESGSGGTYCRVTAAAEVAESGYFTMPITTLRQLRWGSTKVIFATLPDENLVEYRGKIRGKLAVPSSPDPVIRNRPKQDPAFTKFPYAEFTKVLAASYFKAETMEDSQDNILTRIDIEPLDKVFDDGKKSYSHKLFVTVHDSYRAAFSSDFCHAEGPGSTSVLQATLLWQFLKGCSALGTDFFDMSLSDGTIFLRSKDMLCVSPLIHGEVRDVKKWADSFQEDEADFYFIVDITELWDAIIEVSSIQDSDTEAEKRLKIRCAGDGLILSVAGTLGSASRKVAIHKGRKGSIDVDFGFLLDSLRLFKKNNQPIRLTVWDGAVRMDVHGDVTSTHFMAAMSE